MNSRLLSSRLKLAVKIVFVVGVSSSSTEQAYVRYESEMYEDIIQYDFIDSYNNNTYKAMSYLRYVVICE